MENTLKALSNEVTVIGRVKEIALEEGTTKAGKENIKGYVVILVKESVNGEIRHHNIRVRVYSNKYKNDGNINGLFTGYETVMNEYKSIEDTGDEKEADLVRVNGSLELNEYIGQDGSRHSNTQVSAKFFNRLDTTNLSKKDKPKAEVKIEAVVEQIEDVLEDGLPTDDKKLKGFNVDFFGQLRENSKPIVPFEAIVPSDIADAFDNLYDSGDTGKFTLKINNYAEEIEKEEEEEISGFGNTEGLQDVKRSFVNNLEVIGGTMPYEEPKAYDEEQIEEAKKFRKKALDDLEAGYVPKSNETEEKNAFGTNSTEVTEDVSDDDLDLDF